MTDHTTHGCEEFQGAATSRRGFLRGLAAVTGAGVVTAVDGSVVTQTSYAATGTSDAVLVVLSMRGGADGLSLVVPHGDPAYYAARPRIGVPSASLVAKDGMFGLHPRLKPLLPLWNEGRLAAVQATGMQSPNRSHFAAMEIVEDADPGSSVRSGWINRLIGLDTVESPLQAMQFGESITPAMLYGPSPTLVTRDVSDVELPGSSNRDQTKRKLAAIDTTWGQESGPLGRGMRSAVRAVNQFRPVQKAPEKPANGATYPSGDLGKAMSAAARTIRANVGAEVITVDFGSWDMHANLGTVERGEMFLMAHEMAQAIAAFFTDLGRLGNQVTLVTISEFGRRV